MKEGKDLSADMDTCEGEIEVLQKELQSIDEGGYSIFLEAKDLIAPKKEISAKKTKLRKEMDGLEKEIEHLELRLSMANLTDDQAFQNDPFDLEQERDAEGVEGGDGGPSEF